MVYDLIVVGGGAAGFFTAIQTAEQAEQLGLEPLNILILEKTAQVLGKVKISGGGRCNVTHACFDPKLLVKNYPRGEKTLMGAFYEFQPQDMIEWLDSHNVEIKTEADGRMFPVSDDSQTIIRALMNAAKFHHIEVQVKHGVDWVEALEQGQQDDARFQLFTAREETLRTKNLMLATGGTRLAAGAKLAEQLGYELIEAVPSLFTFNISDRRIHDLPGLSVDNVTVKVLNQKLEATGPLLITHWGMSGPAILKLSAWGARALAEVDYQFSIEIDWLPARTQEQIRQEFKRQHSAHGKRFISKRSVFSELPRRLWEQLVQAAGIDDDNTWAQLSKAQLQELIKQLKQGHFNANGKSINKDEFVTCGGVQLKDINPKTCESKHHQGLYFSGEVLDIDGITGGFNFQNAWTGAHLAAKSITQS